MHILQLTHLLPWPPIDGGKKGVLGFVEGYRRHPAVQSHDLISICPQDQVQWAEEWKPLGEPPQFAVADTRNRLLPFLANTLFSRTPYNMQKYQLGSVRRLLERAIARQTPDMVHFDGSHTAGYARLVRELAPGALRVLRSHNAEYVILERYAEAERNPLKRALIALQARRLKRYEARKLDEFDLILAITELDAVRLASINPGCADRIMVVPAGVDVPATLPPPPARGGKIRMMYMGVMNWLPNQASLRWFLKEVLPRLDAEGLDYHLDVVGQKMPDEFMRLKIPHVTVRGFVEDLNPLLASTHLAVIPLHVGGGMRVKILHFWSSGIPIVATQIGAEGLSDDRPPLLAVADSPEDFASAILRLAKDPDERDRMREAAFAKIVMSYGWPALIDRVINRVLSLREGIRVSHP